MSESFLAFFEVTFDFKRARRLFEGANIKKYMVSETIALARIYTIATVVSVDEIKGVMRAKWICAPRTEYQISLGLGRKIVAGHRNPIFSDHAEKVPSDGELIVIKFDVSRPKEALAWGMHDDLLTVLSTYERFRDRRYAVEETDPDIRHTAPVKTVQAAMPPRSRPSASVYYAAGEAIPPKYSHGHQKKERRRMPSIRFIQTSTAISA